MGIRRNDLVLDVGSGGGPNPRANVLCDRFVSDGVERGGSPLVSDRPFVVGDVERLPFVDKAFDFVICSHVLEHVRNPGAAIAELQRVGRRGYIETPSAEWEKLTGFPFHRWMVSYSDRRLVFEHKQAPIQDPHLRAWFAHFQADLGIATRVWLRRRQLHVYTWLRWEDEIPFEVHARTDVDDEFVDAAVSWTDDGVRQQSLGLASKLIDRWGRLDRARSGRRLGDGLLTLVRCPDCFGRLTRSGRSLECESGAHKYPIDSSDRLWLLDGISD